jgi:hypothetical protein
VSGGKVDVLSVLGTAHARLNRAGETAPSHNERQACCDSAAALFKAAAAVAELIEAARGCMDCELAGMACVGSMAPAEDALGKLQAALACVGGAK